MLNILNTHLDQCLNIFLSVKVLGLLTRRRPLYGPSVNIVKTFAKIR